MNTRTESTDKPPPRDHRQEVTNDIIRLLETGTAPWQKPWEGGSQMPMNPTTGKSYRGGNVLALMISGMRKGYGDPRWMTYKQASDKGWQVRKGEKGTQIEFWEAKPGSKAETGRRRQARPSDTPGLYGLQCAANRRHTGHRHRAAQKLRDHQRRREYSGELRGRHPPRRRPGLLQPPQRPCTAPAERMLHRRSRLLRHGLP